MCPWKYGEKNIMKGKYKKKKRKYTTYLVPRYNHMLQRGICNEFNVPSGTDSRSFTNTTLIIVFYFPHRNVCILVFALLRGCCVRIKIKIGEFGCKNNNRKCFIYSLCLHHFLLFYGNFLKYYVWFEVWENIIESIINWYLRISENFKNNYVTFGF